MDQCDTCLGWAKSSGARQGAPRRAKEIRRRWRLSSASTRTSGLAPDRDAHGRPLGRKYRSTEVRGHVTAAPSVHQRLTERQAAVQFRRGHTTLSASDDGLGGHGPSRQMHPDPRRPSPTDGSACSWHDRARHRHMPRFMGQKGICVRHAMTQSRLCRTRTGLNPLPHMSIWAGLSC
jgi:hypothetical protein